MKLLVFVPMYSVHTSSQYIVLNDKKMEQMEALPKMIAEPYVSLHG